MVRITAVKKMKPFKTSEESPPASGKVPTTFKPKAFYTSVVSGPVNVRQGCSEIAEVLHLLK